MPIENRSRGSVGNTSVTKSSFSFGGNGGIKQFQGSAAGEDGRIASTDVIDFDVELGEVIEPEKFANAVGIKPVSKAVSILAALGEFFEDVACTAAVVATSITSGVLKLGEKVLDGVVWVGATAGSLMGFDTTGMKEFIARDLTAEANAAFYEGTDLGRYINENSALKYDSEFAQGIQNVTEKAVEIAAATALTVCTGGAAAPFVVGTIVGFGTAAESTYQTHGTNTTVLQELGIAGSGVLTGMAWVANGKLGQGAINIGKDIAQNGAKEVLGSMAKHVFTKDFLREQFRKTLSLRTVTEQGKKVLNFNAIMNYVSSAMGTGQSLVPYITGEEEFDATAALKITGTYLKYLGLNVLEDMARDYVSDYSQGKYATDYIDDVIHGRVRQGDVDEPNQTGLFGFFKKKTVPPKELNFNEWQAEINGAMFATTINGITFRSKTQEGLNDLVSYYQEVTRRGGVNGAYFTSLLSGKSLTITDIPNKVDAGAYHWGGYVFFDKDTLNNKALSTFYHECGHYLDYASVDSEKQLFLNIIQGLKDPQYFDAQAQLQRFKADYDANYQNIINEAYAQQQNLIFEFGQRMPYEVSNWDQLSSRQQAKLIEDAVNQAINTRIRQNLDDSGYTAISDIFDAITGGTLHDKMYMAGHGGKYFQDETMQYKELLADFSDLYNNNHLGLLDQYFPPVVRTVLTDSYEKLIDINALRFKFLNGQFSQDVKYGKGSFDTALIDFLFTGDAKVLTRDGGVRDLVTGMDPSSISKYLTLPDNRTRILGELQSLVDGTHGDGYFVQCIRSYLNGNNGLNVFTRDNNVRNYMSLLSQQDLFDFLKSIGG